MKLQSKVAIIVAGAWLAICLIIFADSRWVLRANYEQLENRMAEMQVRDVRRAYEHSLLALQMYSTAWAVWDEAYAFMQKKDPKFINSNFVSGTFTSSHINFFMFFDNAGKLYYGKFYDLARSKMSDVPNSTLSYIEQNKDFAIHNDPSSKKIGILNTKDGLIVMSSLPVLTGD